MNTSPSQADKASDRAQTRVSVLTPAEALECDLSALERVIETLSKRYEYESQDVDPPHQPTISYLLERLEVLYNEWQVARARVEARPKIIDLSWRSGGPVVRVKSESGGA